MIQSLESAASITVMGHFDGVEDETAVGWAFYPAHPAQRVHIEILCEGEVVAFGIADQFREDLAPAGIGDGHHLFRLPLSYELMDGRVHSLEARDARTGSSLHSSSISFGPKKTVLNSELIPRAKGLNWLEKVIETTSFQDKVNKAPAYKKLYQIGALAQETGRLDDARYAWNALLKAIGNNALCLCKIGETYLLEGNAELALKAYLSAAAEDLTAPWVHLGIAEAKRRLGLRDEAQEAKEIADALYSPEQHADLNLHRGLASNPLREAEVLLHQGEQDKALQVLREALIADPENRKVALKIGDILTKETNNNSNLPGMEALWRLRKAQLTLELFLSNADQKDPLPTRSM